MRSSSLLVLASLACCAAPRAPASSDRDPVAQDAPALPAPASAPERPCAHLPPRVSRYDDLAPGHPFSVQLARRDGGEWLPDPPLAMPHHHSSRIEWESEDVLETRRDRVVVSAISTGEPAIQQRPGQLTWRATYPARIVRVCP